MKIIFQGAWTGDCRKEYILSVKNWYSGPIIFSTWESEKAKIPFIDNLYLLPLKDPGPGPIQNLKRQVIGLKEALDRFVDDDELVLKLRSDMSCPTNPNNFYKAEVCCDMFTRKVGISRIMTRDPVTFPWFISDWIWLGLGRDLKRIASIDFDDIKIVSNSTEATWAKKLHSLYSKSKTPVEFVTNNYQVLNITSDIGMECAHYRGQPENHPFYIK